MSGLFRTNLSTPPPAADGALPNPTTGEMPDDVNPPVQEPTLFDKALDKKQGQEQEVTEPTVIMPDGSKVPASEYVQEQTAQERVDLAAKAAALEERERWLRPPEDPPPGTDEAATTPEPLEWQPPAIDQDTLEENEVLLYSHLNSMGGQFTGIVNDLRNENHELKRQLGDTSRVTGEIQLNNEYARLEAQYGVTPQEVMEVHREYPNSYDLHLLAQSAQARNQTAENQDEMTIQRREQQNENLSKIGGASNQQGASRANQPDDRASQITDWTDGAQIAKYYKGRMTS